MKKDTIIVLVIIALGFSIFLLGITWGEIVWCIIGGLLVILPPVALEIERKRERKSLLRLMENENRPILSTRKNQKDIDEQERWKKIRLFIEKIMIMALVAAAAAGLVVIMVQRFVTQPSYISAETAIVEACSIYSRVNCKTDPSMISVKYDVNGDGIVSGDGDNLESLLELYNCTGNCIKMRCSCIT